VSQIDAPDEGVHVPRIAGKLNNLRHFGDAAARRLRGDPRAGRGETSAMRRQLVGLAAVILAAGCAGHHLTGGGEPTTAAPEVDAFVYQLQGYAEDRLDELAEAPQELAVIDLARDGNED
jgi:hypothetical protein